MKIQDKAYSRQVNQHRFCEINVGRTKFQPRMKFPSTLIRRDKQGEESADGYESSNACALCVG